VKLRHARPPSFRRIARERQTARGHASFILALAGVASLTMACLAVPHIAAAAPATAPPGPIDLLRGIFGGGFASCYNDQLRCAAGGEVICCPLHDACCSGERGPYCCTRERRRAGPPPPRPVPPPPGYAPPPPPAYAAPPPPSYAAPPPARPYDAPPPPPPPSAGSSRSQPYEAPPPPPPDACPARDVPCTNGEQTVCCPAGQRCCTDASGPYCCGDSSGGSNGQP